jgi:hypothetical protein
VVKAITEAVGDLNINGGDAAAAIHAKCLVCDKPITSGGAGARARTAAAGGTKAKSGSLVSSSMPLLGMGYGKGLDDASTSAAAAAAQGEGAMFSRLLSPNPAVSHAERVKVATELNILRSSIDPLPEINVCPSPCCCVFVVVVVVVVAYMLQSVLLDKLFCFVLFCFVSFLDFYFFFSCLPYQSLGAPDL